MAGWNGSGTFSRTYNWVQDQANGIKIVASRHDANDVDFVNGINNCLTKDGQNSPSAALPMATYNHTNVGKATALNQYATAEQVVDNELQYYAASGTDTYAITPNPAIAAYAAGQSFYVNFTNGNTGAATLNVSGLGAKALTREVSTALASGDLVAGKIYEVVYDGTRFQVKDIQTGITALTGDVTASGNGSQVATIANDAVTTVKVADNAITLAKMAGGTDGNLITYDTNGDPAYVATGTSGQVLTSNGAGAAPTFQTPTSTFILQAPQRASTTATTALNTVFVADNSIPQNTEGTEVLTVSITPTSASSLLEIEALIHIGENANSDTLMAGLFVDSTANALAFGCSHPALSGAIGQVKIYFTVSAGSTSARTYKIRAGSTGTAVLNSSTSATFGGVFTSYLKVTEVTS